MAAQMNSSSMNLEEMTAQMNSCLMNMNLEEDVNGNFYGSESNSSVDDGSPHDRKFRGFSSDLKKADSDGGREEEEDVKFEEGFAELAAMDVVGEGMKFHLPAAMDFIEEDDDDDDAYIFTSSQSQPEYRYSDWWETNSDDDCDNDIIDPQDWEAAGILYNQQINDSNGFNVDDFKGKYCGLGMILPMTISEEDSSFKIIHQLSVLAIEKYNRDNGTSYQFMEVEKVNCQLAGDLVYYITFKAKQIADAEITFQAVGYWGWVPDKKGKEDLSVNYCRLKPTN